MGGGIEKDKESDGQIWAPSELQEGGTRKNVQKNAKNTSLVALITSTVSLDITIYYTPDVLVIEDVA